MPYIVLAFSGALAMIYGLGVLMSSTWGHVWLIGGFILLAIGVTQHHSRMRGES